MTKRAGRSQAPSEGVGDRAPLGGTSAAATTKAQQHLRVRTAGELGTDPLTCARQLQGLAMERGADPAGRGMQQQPLERLPGEQPAQSPVVPGGQYGDHTEGLRSVLLRCAGYHHPVAPRSKPRAANSGPSGCLRQAVTGTPSRRLSLGGRAQRTRSAAKGGLLRWTSSAARIRSAGGWCRLAS